MAGLPSAQYMVVSCAYLEIECTAKRSLAALMKFYGIVVNFNIAHGRRLPGVISSHPPQLKFPPDIFETVKFKRTYNGSKQLPGIIIGEDKTVAFTTARVVLLNGIGQAANGSHDRNATIAHGYELTQTAGLKPRRHEEHIAARIDALRHFCIEGKKNR